MNSDFIRVNSCQFVDKFPAWLENDLSQRRKGTLKVERAIAGDAPELTALHIAVAERLTQVHGRGPWSGHTSEKGVLLAIRQSSVFVARQRGAIVGTFRLATKKPWAIDVSYFSKCEKALYLLAMAVLPARQRQGIGRGCLEEAHKIALAWPANAIRLDAFDAAAGAGGFYERCGYRQRGRMIYRNARLIYYEFMLGEGKKN